LFKAVRQGYALFFLRLGNAVITFSEFGRSYLLQRSFPANNVFTAPNTLDTDKLCRLAHKAKQQMPRSQIAADLALPPDRRYMLFMGRLLQAKRVDHAIRAMAIIHRAIPNVHLIVMGDGNLKAELIAQAEAMAPGSITFTGGIFDEALKSKYFSLAEVFFMPGCVGLAIVHAFCFGLPIITEDLPFHGPEIQYLHDGENGYMVPDGDIKSLAEKVIYLLKNRSELNRLSKNAVRTAETEANVNRMISQMALALKL